MAVSSAKAATRDRRGRWALVAIVLLFLSGFIAALVLNAIGWEPSSTKNYGELVRPARPLTDVALRDLQGQPVRVSELRGRWTLLYFGSAECLRPCADSLYKMRQLVAAQGREAHRVRALFVVTDPRALDGLRYTLADYPGTEVWTGAAPSVHELMAQFLPPGGTALADQHRLYVIDPLGNFMMSYPATAELRRMNKDLGLLLRTSQIG
jgi:hypothetical protein